MNYEHWAAESPRSKVVPFIPASRNTARQVAEKVASLALHEKQSHCFSEEELASVILVAIGEYKEVVGR